MNYRLSFTELVNYDAGQPSITLGITLSVGEARVFCNAKLDTGSSHCIFARHIGEELGIDIETVLRLLVGTVTGKFITYLHEVNLSVASFEFSSLIAFAATRSFSVTSWADMDSSSRCRSVWSTTKENCTWAVMEINERLAELSDRTKGGEVLICYENWCPRRDSNARPSA